MSFSRVWAVVWANVGRNRRAFLLSSVGLVIGVATLTFFVHLGLGVQQGVLNRIFPVNQIEVEPKTVGVVGTRQDLVDQARLGTQLIEDFKALPGVSEVYPKLRSKFQARLWGGEALLGYATRAEAFFEGLDARLLTPELRATEDQTSPPRKRRHQDPCRSDEECRLGEECSAAGQCEEIRYWSRFQEGAVTNTCMPDSTTGLPTCPSGLTCVQGLCLSGCESCGEGSRCVTKAEVQVCLPACQSDAQCHDGEVCNTELGVCERLRCAFTEPREQLRDDPALSGGRLLDRCANGVAPGSPGCEPLACPGRTYCAAQSVLSTEGFCELPIPVVLSPTLIELFNNAAANSLDMQKIDGLAALLGIQFQLHFGDSYLAADLPKAQQMVKRSEVVGFSSKAADFGVTMPLRTIEQLNARYKGSESASRYDTFILETEANEDVSLLIGSLDSFGMTLARRSETAQKAGDLLFILTIVFSFISVVILVVAGVNIMHTFLTLVTERRHEIGIMRAVGATRGDIRALFLSEALLLGLFGGVLGNLVSWVVTRGVNWAGQHYLANIPYKPEDFFAYDWRVMLGGIAFACLFCLLGAWLPAGRAAKLDPASVLAS